MTDRDRLAPLNAASPGQLVVLISSALPASSPACDAKTLPGPREAIDLKQWDLARRQSEVLRRAIVAVTQEVSQAARQLR